MLFFCGAIGLLQQTPADAKVVIIVSHNNPESSIKVSVIKRMFLRKKSKWSNGEKVVPVDLSSDSEARTEFSTSILGKSVKEMESHWISEIVTGGKEAPEIVADSSLAKEAVANNPGAIAYIDENDLDESVKAIDVIK